MGHRFIKIHPQIHAENTALFKKRLSKYLTIYLGSTLLLFVLVGISIIVNIICICLVVGKWSVVSNQFALI